MARREDVPIARVPFGRNPWQALMIYGWPASEMGMPSVEVRGDYESMNLMKPEIAEQLAEGLKLAARVARGEVLPTALDQFLAKRQS